MEAAEKGAGDCVVYCGTKTATRPGSFGVDASAAANRLSIIKIDLVAGWALVDWASRIGSRRRLALKNLRPTS